MRKAYFVVAFSLMTVLGVVLGVNWWIALTRLDLLILAIPAAVVATAITASSAFMAVVAARYK